MTTTPAPAALAAGAGTPDTIYRKDLAMPISRARLEQAIELFDHLARQDEVVIRQVFDMSIWLQRPPQSHHELDLPQLVNSAYHCRTAACAAGWMALLAPDVGADPDIEQIALDWLTDDNLDDNVEQAFDDLFNGFAFDCMLEDVTPAMIADVLRFVLTNNAMPYVIVTWPDVDVTTEPILPVWKLGPHHNHYDLEIV